MGGMLNPGMPIMVNPGQQIIIIQGGLNIDPWLVLNQQNGLYIKQKFNVFTNSPCCRAP